MTNEKQYENEIRPEESEMEEKSPAPDEELMASVEEGSGEKTSAEEAPADEAKIEEPKVEEPGDVEQEPAPAKSLLKSGPKKEGMAWYVVHTYSGYENKARLALEERIHLKGMGPYFEEVIVPEENVIELVKGQKKTTKRRFFPGYILVRMVLTDETWHIVKNTPKITGFVGDRTRPQPVADSEVLKMTNRIAEGEVKPRPRVSFKEGESVRVVDGPFSNFNGVIEEVNVDKGKVKVNVSIFGRATPVEFDFIQVEKV